MRKLAWVGVAVALAGCGAGADRSAEGSRTERYGISMEAPRGWYGEITRGTVYLGTVARDTKLRPGDTFVVLYEYQPAPPEHVAASSHYQDAWPVRFEPADFGRLDSESEAALLYGAARRGVTLAGRLFDVFAQSGSRPPPAARVAELNEALASVRVSPGDYYPGSVDPARFPERRGWETGTSGPSERYPQGEYAQTWASTGPYPDPPNALPPRRSIEALASDGILIWVGLTRDARLAPNLDGGAFEAKEPPYRIADLERLDVWEGQVRDVPQYRLWAVSERGYQVDLRVYFGRADPTDGMLAEADTMLAGLEFPDWGPWELA